MSLAAAPVLLLVLAGCLGAGTTPLAPADAAPAPLGLEGDGCSWGGGHSIHTHEIAPQIVPEPWKVADVVEDIGAQPTYSDPGEQVYGVATSGWGNWHTNLACASWTLDGEDAPGLVLGMVLARVEAPPFDPAPVHRNYIVNVIASDSDALNARLMARGWMSMGATGQLSWADGTLHHVLATDMHGTYESLFRTRDVGALEDDVVRLWYQKENANGTFSPVAVDLRIVGEPPTHALADPEGYFSHTGTDDHALLLGQPSGVAGQIAGLAYRGFSFRLEWGPEPAVALDEAYSHL